MKNKILLLHHLSGSGGTIITKLISTDRKVRTLNEINPNTVSFNNENFSPTTLVEQFFTRYDFEENPNKPSLKNLVKDKFSFELSLINKHCIKFGLKLVLRDWSFGDFFYPEGDLEGNLKKIVDETQSSFSEINSLVTLRHPMDTFLSNLRSDFVKLESFSTFCISMEQFILYYQKQGAKFIKYEDIINNVESFIDFMDKNYDIKIPNDYLSLINIYSFSGDSGRKSEKLELHPRTDEDYEIIYSNALNQQEPYINLVNVLGYKI